MAEDSRYKVTIYIADTGAPTINADGTLGEPSKFGHMWLSLDDNQTGIQSPYGFHPAIDGSAISKVGKVETRDNVAYPERWSTSIPITEQQYQQLTSLCQKSIANNTFGPYLGVSNSCVDYTMNILRNIDFGNKLTMNSGMTIPNPHIGNAAPIPVNNISIITDAKTYYMNHVWGHEKEQRVEPYFQERWRTGGASLQDSSAVAVMIKEKPLTKLQADKMAISYYVKGEDQQLEQQAKELKIKRDQLNLAEDDNLAYGRKYNFDKTLWRYAPEIFKGEGLKYYESSIAMIKNNNQFFDGQEANLQSKMVVLQERLQTPEACLEIGKKSQEYLAKDQERLAMLEPLNHKLNEVNKEQNKISDLNTAIQFRKSEHEINLQGDGKDAHNILRQADQIKQQVAEMQMTMGRGQSRSR